MRKSLTWYLSSQRTRGSQKMSHLYQVRQKILREQHLISCLGTKWMRWAIISSSSWFWPYPQMTRVMQKNLTWSRLNNWSVNRITWMRLLPENTSGKRYLSKDKLSYRRNISWCSTNYAQSRSTATNETATCLKSRICPKKWSKPSTNFKTKKTWSNAEWWLKKICQTASKESRDTYFQLRHWSMIRRYLWRNCKKSKLSGRRTIKFSRSAK